MPRAKRGFKRRHRVSKWADRSEGFVMGRGTGYRRALEAARRAGVYTYRDRKRKKRQFRQLWIARLSAAANLHDISYSRLMGALRKSQVDLNRKMLSEIAIRDPQGFSLIVNEVRSAAPAV